MEMIEMVIDEKEEEERKKAETKELFEEFISNQMDDINDDEDDPMNGINEEEDYDDDPMNGINEEEKEEEDNFDEYYGRSQEIETEETKKRQMITYSQGTPNENVFDTIFDESSKKKKRKKMNLRNLVTFMGEDGDEEYQNQLFIKPKRRKKKVEKRVDNSMDVDDDNIDTDVKIDDPKPVLYFF